MAEEMIVVHEYKIKIDVLEEYHKYCQKYRESTYRLNNLLSMYDSKIYGDELLNQANLYLEEYDKFDDGQIVKDEIANRIDSTCEEDTVNKEIKISDLFIYIKTALIGKSNIDSIQYKILQKMYSTYAELNDDLINNYKIEGRIVRDERLKRTLSYIKNDSHLRDRLDTFEIKLNIKSMKPKERKETLEELKSNGFKEIYYVSGVRNYDFLIDEEIKKVEAELKYLLLLNDMIEDDKIRKINDRKNNLQYIFNIIVGFSTVIGLIVSILTFIYKD